MTNAICLIVLCYGLFELSCWTGDLLLGWLDRRFSRE